MTQDSSFFNIIVTFMIAFFLMDLSTMDTL